jgi:hypothetical protein
MRGVPAVLVVLAACALPSTEPLNAEIQGPDEAPGSASLETDAWSRALGLHRALPALPEIRWYVGCLEYDPAYMRPAWYDGCVEGRYWKDEDRIDLKDVSGQECHSSQAHELLHWALGEARGDTDSDHVDPLWDEVCDVKAAALVAQGQALLAATLCPTDG